MKHYKSSPVGRVVISLLLVLCCTVVPLVGPLRAASFSLSSGDAARITTRSSLPDNFMPGNGQGGTNFKSFPLRFELNEGQSDNQVKFMARGRDGMVFLTSTEAVVRVTSCPADYRQGSRRRISVERPVAPDAADVRSAVVRLRTVGANANAHITGLDMLPGKTNYFIGNDPAKWRTNVPGYAKVKYENVYAGIDVIYYGNEGALEYDFKVAPGADPGQIAISVEGADGVEVDEIGNLVLRTAAGEVRQHAPRIYQEVNGARREISGGYRLLDRPQSNSIAEAGRCVVGFDVGAYDASRSLVIDPKVVYATLLGGAAGYYEGANGVAVDAAGNAYVVGETQSSDFPITTNALQRNLNGSSDAFITKLGPNGELLYSTFFGGGSFDSANAIALDASGAIYIAGNTGSRDLPIKNAAQPGYGGNEMDGFIAKLTADGAALVYSTYLGGDQNDIVTNLALDSHGNAYVAGSVSLASGTTATFPLVNPIQDTYGGGRSDAFVSVLSADGRALLFSTFLDVGLRAGREASNEDIIKSILVDSTSGDIYIAGRAIFSDPIPGVPFMSRFRRVNQTFTDGASPPPGVIVYFQIIILWAKLTYETLTPQERSKAKADLGWLIRLASNKPPSLDAATAPSVEVLSGGYCHPIPPSTSCDDAAAVAFFDQDLKFQQATNVSALDNIYIDSVTTDSQGAVYILGDATSGLQTVNPIQATPGGSSDCVLVVLAPGSFQPVFATYFGGSGDESPYQVVVDPQGNIYLTGNLFGFGTHTFPATPGALQTSPKGVNDAFVVKISPVSFPTGPDFTLGFDSPIVTGQAGTKARVTVNINRTGGFTGNVTVTPPSPSGGIKAKPADPITTTDNGATFKIKIGGGVAPGSYQLTFTGQDDSGKTRSAIVTLIVQ